MKFLQEMIAKKRAQQGEMPGTAPVANAERHAAGEGMVRSEPHHLMQDVRHADDHDGWTETPRAMEESEEDLFDDGSYDWDLEKVEPRDFEPAAAGSGEGCAEDEDPEDEDDPWASAAAPTRSAEHAIDDVEEDAEDDEIDFGTSLVLKDIVAKSRAEGPAALREAAPEARKASIEENVEKLRVQRKIWELENEGDEAEDSGAPVDAGSEPPMDEPTEIDEAVEEMPPLRAVRPAPTPMRRDFGAPIEADDEEPAADPAPQPQSRRAGRVKTRLLGFHKGQVTQPDPFASAQEPKPAPQGEPLFPVGWLVVVQGPGRGASFTLTAGASKIGRGEDQAVRLDFGDTSISRDNHAAVAYDDEQRLFYIGHGGKANLVRLNDMPVLSTEMLNDGDLIRIGETTLQFVAFCGPEFAWDEDADGDSLHAAAE